MRARTLAVIASALLAGCAAQSTTNPGLTQDQLEVALSQTRQQLATDVGALCANETQVAEVQQEITRLNQRLEQMDEGSKKVTTPVPVVKECPKNAMADMLLLGEAEMVYVEEFGTGFATRIDTGAESSSVNAQNIQRFERDGKNWVRFDIQVQEGDATVAQTKEARVVRYVQIKQQAGEKSERRPVIMGHIQIGDYKAETELNLTDRSHLEYPMLLGRKFMKDIAVVDVGKKFVHGKTAPMPKPAKSTK
ncbi:ATP-dependent zinc protease family protein [Paraferrimonas sedimenticola]|uniref:ATP-dependent Zn protease n=1 Tax=Paraferrimonas sedimenticola TaxID=375674 RepID=A0AA37RVZ5_9GAMM|nr:ATP-dependent zinc protease [Paraferrimonas sedimenticola]GLP96166.1 ATP-dependent Zn protease [Paraferrimonas sedimenticola]